MSCVTGIAPLTAAYLKASEDVKNRCKSTKINYQKNQLPNYENSLESNELDPRDFNDIKQTLIKIKQYPYNQTEQAVATGWYSPIYQKPIKLRVSCFSNKKNKNSCAVQKKLRFESSKENESPNNIQTDLSETSEFEIEMEKIEKEFLEKRTAFAEEYRSQLRRENERKLKAERERIIIEKLRNFIKSIPIAEGLENSEANTELKIFFDNLIIQNLKNNNNELVSNEIIENSNMVEESSFLCHDEIDLVKCEKLNALCAHIINGYRLDVTSIIDDDGGSNSSSCKLKELKLVVSECLEKQMEIQSYLESRLGLNFDRS